MFVSGVSFMVARLSVHGDVKVKPWTIMENQFVHMPPVRSARPPRRWRRRESSAARRGC